MPKVSVIIPIYKVENCIEKCARSLFEQTFESIEYIFVNDATPDNSINILENILLEYPNRKKNSIIINHSVNKGQSAARNSGLYVSSGDFIIYCDSDDWMASSMIEEMYRYALENSADIVSCDFQMVYNDYKVNYQTVNFSNNKIDSIQKYISCGWTVLWNLLVKRSLYIDNNIQSLEGYSYCEDFNLSIKLLLNSHKTIHLNKVLYYYNKTNLSSVMHGLNYKTMKDELTMYIDVINYLKVKGVYKYYEKQMGWRILKSKQELVLNEDTYDVFLKTNPDSHKYIWSCPYINLKLKIMMWTLTHNLTFVSKFMLFLRYLRHGKKI